MRAHLEGVTVLADDVPALATFYRDALGLEVAVWEHQYVAFRGEGVRVAIFSRPDMAPHTNAHPDYRLPRSGQAFELNFQHATEAAVDAHFAHICATGGVAIAPPVRQAWGDYTGFFADPEGNIHSLFAPAPVQTTTG